MKSATVVVLFSLLFAFSSNAQTNDRPTSQDSLDLYNNTVKVLKYYQDRNYTGENASSAYGIYIANTSVFEDLHEALLRFNSRNGDVAYPDAHGKRTTGDLALEDYYRKIDKNKFYQRETANWILDTRAPMPLYDKRILPTAFYTFYNENTDDPMFGDAVSITGYDPIAIKPERMLTSEERVLRQERYGTSAGVSKRTVIPFEQQQKKVAATKPTTTAKAPVPKQKKSVVVKSSTDATIFASDSVSFSIGDVKTYDHDIVMVGLYRNGKIIKMFPQFELKLKLSEWKAFRVPTGVTVIIRAVSEGQVSMCSISVRLADGRQFDMQTNKGKSMTIRIEKEEL